ncbi:translocation/assembly module TamB domain-containing protein [Candidatus Latescibacterota bacterium]
MRGRKWVLIILLISIAVIGGFIAIDRIFHIKQKAGDYIVEIISARLGMDFEASSVYILPWSFGIRDARLRLKDTPLSIETRRIRIEYSIISFLKNMLIHRSLPTNMIESWTKNVFFDEPCLKWILFEEDSKSGHLDLENIPEFFLRELPFIRLNIANGSLVFIRSDSVLTFAENITGWLDGSLSTDINMNVEGKVLSGEINTTCKGVFDREKNTVAIDIKSSACDFSQKGLDLLTGDIRLESGTLDFQIHLEKEGLDYVSVSDTTSRDKDENLTLTGTYSVEKGSFMLKDSGISVSDVNISGHLDESELSFDSVTGKVWNVKPQLSGQLKLKPEPSLYFALNANDIDLATVFMELLPERETYPEGLVNLSSIIEGSLGDLSVKMTCSSDSLNFRKDRIYDAEVKMNITGSDVNFESFNALYRGFQLRGHGKTGKLLPLSNITSSKSDFAFSVNARNVSDPPINFALSFNGTANPEYKEYSADFELDLKSSNFGMFNDKKGELADTFKGNVFLRGDGLEYTFGNSLMNVNGTVKDIFERAEITSELTVTKFPVLSYLGISDAGFFVDGKSTVSGNSDTLSIASDLRLNAGKNLNSLFTGEFFVENIFDDNRLITGDAELIDHHIRYSDPMNWKLSVHSDSRSTNAVVIEPEGAVLKLDAVHETEELSGQLELDDFPLEWIIDIFKREEFRHKGKITGKALVGGTIRKPWFYTPEKTLVTDMNIGGLNNLTGAVYVSGKPGELLFTDADVDRNSMPILHGEGRWVSGEPFIVEAQGKDVSLGAISNLIDKSRISNGNTNYSFSMVYTRKNGTIDGEFEIRDGYFLDIPFDRASGKLGGGSDGFNVTNFSIDREDLFAGKGSASSGYFWFDATEDPGLKMDLTFQGDLLRILPHLTNAVERSSGKSQLKLRFGGSWLEPVVMDGELSVSGGKIIPSFLNDPITDVNVLLIIDPEIKTLSDLTAVHIRSASGMVQDKKFIVSNVFIGDKEWETLKKPELLSIVNSRAGLDFGVLTGRIDIAKQHDATIEMHVPGFMKPKEKGTFLLAGEKDYPFLIGTSYAEDNLAPYISGSIVVLSGDCTYPLLDVDSVEEDTDFLQDVFWNLIIHAGSNVNYVYENNIRIGGFGNFAGTTLARVQAKLYENSVFTVNGRLSDDSFRVTGDANSSSGTITYYGAEFDIERAKLELDTTNITRPATLTARARTVVYDDSTDVDTEILLNVYSIDRVSGQRSDASGRVEARNDFSTKSTNITFDAGALGIIEIGFTSNNPADDSQGKILARLGISPENIRNATTGAFTAGLDNYYFSTFLRPFEDTIKRYTKFDVVKFTPSVLGNIVRSQLGFNDQFGPDTDYMIFDRSRIMVGEYFFNDLFLTYRGQYGIGRNYLQRRERGFYHQFGIQYLLKNNTRLQLNYDYDDIISRGEKRIEIRHDFEF